MGDKTFKKKEIWAYDCIYRIIVFDGQRHKSVGHYNRKVDLEINYTSILICLKLRLFPPIIGFWKNKENISLGINSICFFTNN